MTRNEIYEHLARVYIGKSIEPAKEKKPRHKVRLFGQITLTIITLGFLFYSLTAFLSKKTAYSSNSVIYALNNSPLRIAYNLNEPYPQIKRFSIPVPKVDASKYGDLNFSIRSLEEGSPGIIKIELTNKKNEVSFYFVEDVDLKWKRFSIPLSEFESISDWSNLSDLSFVFEAWNAKKKKGIVLIDDLSFSG